MDPIVERFKTRISEIRQKALPKAPGIGCYFFVVYEDGIGGYRDLLLEGKYPYVLATMTEKSGALPKGVSGKWMCGIVADDSYDDRFPWDL